MGVYERARKSRAENVSKTHLGACDTQSASCHIVTQQTKYSCATTDRRVYRTMQEARYAARRCVAGRCCIASRRLCDRVIMAWVPSQMGRSLMSRFRRHWGGRYRAFKVRDQAPLPVLVGKTRRCILPCSVQPARFARRPHTDSLLFLGIIISKFCLITYLVSSS